MKMHIKALFAVVALGVAGNGLAAVTWTLAGTATANSFSGSTWNINNANITGTSAGGTASLGVTAYANTFGSDAIVGSANGQAVQLQTRTAISGGPLGGTLAGIQDYGTSGLGIINLDACGLSANCDSNEGNTGEHAIDNHQRYEMALLSFGKQVSLTGVTVGWNATDNCGAVNNPTACSAPMHDSDMTVLAYTGGGNPMTSLGGTLNWTQLLANGWSLVGNYSDVGAQTGNTSSLLAGAGNRSGGTGSDGVYSSYWLVGAYNPLANPGGTGPFGDNSDNTCPAGTTGDCTGRFIDSVKLLSVVGETRNNTVPEPGSLTLFGLAAACAVAMRRRKKA